MSSSIEFVEFAAGQLAGAGEITYKRMFGEYGLYCDGLFFATICDDQLFFKPTEAAKRLQPDIPEAPPYQGAKDYFLIEDLDNHLALAELAQATCAELRLAQKPRAKAKAKSKPESAAKPAKEKAFDYKKEYKEFYLPKRQPGLIEVPPLQFLAVRGQGDPNLPDGAYKQAIALLYAAAYAIKMSKMGDYRMEGYFDFVVPPLEGLWWQNGTPGEIDYAHKERFQWLALIRLPEFVTEADFNWAVAQAAKKIPDAAERLELFRYTEGLCVQCLHVGSYDDEPATLRMLHDFVEQQGYQLDFTGGRLHHEIYLSDVRRCKPENLKTVIRLPLKKQ